MLHQVLRWHFQSPSLLLALSASENAPNWPAYGCMLTRICERGVYWAHRMCSSIQRTYELNSQSPVSRDLRDLHIALLPCKLDISVKRLGWYTQSQLCCSLGNRKTPNSQTNYRSQWTADNVKRIREEPANVMNSAHSLFLFSRSLFSLFVIIPVAHDLFVKNIGIYIRRIL